MMMDQSGPNPNAAPRLFQPDNNEILEEYFCGLLCMNMVKFRHVEHPLVLAKSYWPNTEIQIILSLVHLLYDLSVLAYSSVLYLCL